VGFAFGAMFAKIKHKIKKEDTDDIFDTQFLVAIRVSAVAAVLGFLIGLMGV